MISIQILEPDDVVCMDDWCRPLQFVSMSGGASDGYSFQSCYGGSPENNAKWTPVNTVFGSVWRDHSVAALNKLSAQYEFARGDIPEAHRLVGFKPLP